MAPSPESAFHRVAAAHENSGGDLQQCPQLGCRSLTRDKRATSTLRAPVCTPTHTPRRSRTHTAHTPYTYRTHTAHTPHTHCTHTAHRTRPALHTPCTRCSCKASPTSALNTSGGVGIPDYLPGVSWDQFLFFDVWACPDTPPGVNSKENLKTCAGAPRSWSVSFLHHLLTSRPAKAAWS